MIRLPPNGIPGPAHKFVKLTPVPDKSITNALSIARANPEELIREIAQNAPVAFVLSTKT